MAYRVHQTNKKTGITYVYEATSVWDKEKKQPRNKQVCVGKLDPQTGEFVPSKRLNPEQAAARDPTVTARATIIGPSLVLDQVTAEHGLDKILKKTFSESYLQILSMAYFLTARGGPLSHLEAWSKSHAHPYDKVLTSQRISEVLRGIETDEQQTFFKNWGEKISENDYLCYDITSVSSYSELNEYLKYGYNRDHESLKQINLALLFGQKSQIPVYYNRLPGNINDVSTLDKVLKTLNQLELKKLHLVLDRGFYSHKNVDELLATGNKFVLAVPGKPKWVREIIDETKDSIQNPDSYHKMEGEVLYIHSRLLPWGKERKRCYLHLYYNAHAAAQATDDFTEELLAYKKELETGFFNSNHEEAYKTFFAVKETPVRGRKVSFNNVAIAEHRNRYAGFYVLLSNDFKDPLEALSTYRNKDSVEKCFDDLKNQLDMKRLRVHSSPVMDGRFFVQFIALIYMSILRKKMRDSEMLDKYSVRELLLEMETLTQVRYSGKYGQIITEVTKPQRLIMEKLEVALPA